MTRNNGFLDVIDRAFARAEPLCRARFGDLVADIFVDEGAAVQDFGRALLPTGAASNAHFAIVTGDDPAFQGVVPERPDGLNVVSDAELYACWRPTPDWQLTVFDRVRRRGVVWFPRQVPAGALGQPCETLVHAAIEPTDWVIAHGAAVGLDGRFLLLLGSAKAGKSTATLACVRAGWAYAGDDLVLLNPTKGLVAPLFSSARLRHSGAAEFQALADGAFMVSDDGGAPRYELRLSAEPTGGRVVSVLRIRRRGSSSVRIEAARPTAYMGPLLHESSSRAPGCAASMMPKLLGIGNMAPAYVVDTGTDPAAIPDGLRAFLEQTA